jgi:hypothetical protein
VLPITTWSTSALIRDYLQRWKWAYEERKIWYPDGVGVVKDVDIPYLLILVDELMEQLEPDEFWGPTDFISG